MKKIIASVNWLDEIVNMGLPFDKYLAVRLRAFYQYGLSKGMDSDSAFNYAKERLKVNLEKSPKVDKSVRSRVKQVKEINEDEILDSRVSVAKSEVRKIIEVKLREIVGDVSDEEFEKIWNLFRREKNQSLLTNREALEEVARIVGNRVPVKKEEVVEESVKPSEDVFDIAEDYKLYDFIKSMDPSNAERNLILFKKYRSMGYRVSTALDRVRKVGDLREFCNANNIPIELATRCINVYPNLEDAKRELLEWKREGKFGLEADVLPIHSSGTGVEAKI